MKEKHENRYNYELIRMMITFSEKYPEDTTFSYYLGKYYLTVGQHQNAINAFDKLISRNPENPVYYTYKARAHVMNRAFSEAAKNIEQALNIPGADSVLYTIKKRYHFYAQCKDSILFYDSLLSSTPKKAHFYFKRGIFYYDTKCFLAAISDFSEAISLKNKPDYYLHRARSYQAADSIKKALSDYKELLTLTPSNKSVRSEIQNLNKILAVKKNISKLSDMIKENPKQTGYYLKRSKAYTKLRNYTNALNDINEAIKIAPDNPDLYHAKAVIYYRRGSFKEAKENLKLVVKYGSMPNKKLEQAINNALKNMP